MMTQSSCPDRARGFLIQLRGDRRGIAAVEFALIAPIMIAFYFGMSEFCQGFMAQKRMGHVGSAIADMVAQTDTVTTADLTDIFALGSLIMKPFSTTPLKQRITSVTRNAAGVAKVDWSRGSGMSALAVGATVTVPTGVIANGESLIMGEATYDYDSPVDYLMPAITRFSHTYYLRPRRVDTVACSNC